METFETTAKVDGAKAGGAGEAPGRAEQTLSTASHGRDQKKRVTEDGSATGTSEAGRHV